MNARVVELENTVHQKVQRLLPWLNTGHLPDDEQAMAEQHLVDCAHCRGDLDFVRAMRAIEPAPGPAPDMENALAKLLPRLEAQRLAPTPHAPQAIDLRPFGGQRLLRGWVARAMPFALAAQLLLIVGLGAQLMRHQDDYRLLGAAAPAQANVLVVFRPDISERQLRALLQRSAARVVDGPTASNAWLLSVAPTAVDATLANLRAEAGVELAEPMQINGAR